jgi:hypothetical protein
MLVVIQTQFTSWLGDNKSNRLKICLISSRPNAEMRVQYFLTAAGKEMARG